MNVKKNYTNLKVWFTILAICMLSFNYWVNNKFIGNTVGLYKYYLLNFLFLLMYLARVVLRLIYNMVKSLLNDVETSKTMNMYYGEVVKLFFNDNEDTVEKKESSKSTLRMVFDGVVKELIPKISVFIIVFWDSLINDAGTTKEIVLSLIDGFILYVGNVFSLWWILLYIVFFLTVFHLINRILVFITKES